MYVSGFWHIHAKTPRRIVAVSYTHLIKKNLDKMFNKYGVEKYDAFDDVGGKLSFALALLDKENTGLILNAVHSRDNCFLYIIGHGRGIGGLGHHDLGVGVHAGAQAVGLVNADGHRVGGGAAAVSYTHLDVYKRQIFRGISCIMALTEPVVSCRTAMPPASTGYLMAVV